MEWKKFIQWPLILVPGGLVLLLILNTKTGQDAVQGVRQLIASGIFPNNNPGNIRPGSGYTWEGQIGVSPHNFVQFDTVENGLRAAAITALSYQYTDGLTTLAQFGDRWAPPASIGGDNVGAAIGEYGQHLADTLGVDPNAQFDLASGQPFTLGQLVRAIVKNENGVKYLVIPQVTYDQYAQVALAAKGYA